MIASTYISDIVSGIFSRMSASKLSSMGPGVSSSFSLRRRTKVFHDMITAGPYRNTYHSSGKTPFDRGLNMRPSNDEYSCALGLFEDFRCCELRSLTRSSAAYSPKPPMYTNVRSEGSVACSIFTISGSRGAHPPIAVFCSCKARVISFRTFSILPSTCLCKEPRVLATDCSISAAKSR